jgi:hypothetical protein
MKQYTANKETIGQFRAIPPHVLENALYVDTDSCVYDHEPPEEVLQACPIVEEMTGQSLQDLKASGA